MAANRKLTDFFERRGGGEEQFKETIQVAQPGQAPRPAIKIQPGRASRGESDGAHRASRRNPAPSLQTPAGHDQGVVKRGKVFIKSSDDEDSDSSLTSIGNLLGVSRADNMRSTEGEVDGWSSPSLVTPRYEFTLGSLLEQTEKDAAIEAEIAQARATLQLVEHTADRSIGSPPGPDGYLARAGHKNDDGTGEQLLASVVDHQNGQGGVQKIMHAMNRTEALNRPKRWCFFEQGPEVDIREARAFPTECIPLDGWQAMLRDSSMRQQALLTGFAAEMIARQGSLPDEVILWILKELCAEKKADLRNSYLSVLKASSEQVRRLLDHTQITRLFCRLGGSEKAVDIKSPIQPVSDLPNNIDEPRVLSLISMLDVVASDLSIPATEQAMCLLGRLSVDVFVSKAADLLEALDRAYSSLAHSIRENEWKESSVRIARTMSASLPHSSSRLQLLNCIPVYTSRTRLFQRRLALTFLFDDVSYMSRPQDTFLNISEVTGELRRRPEYKIDGGTDYSDLAALISMLDIAIGNGMTWSQSSPPTTTQAERLFNQDIDTLAATIKLMFTQIIDTGASHMTRTEAKEVLNRVYYRMIYAVRTKQKPKQDIFSSSSASSLVVGKTGGDGNATIMRSQGPLSKLFSNAKQTG